MSHLFILGDADNVGRRLQGLLLSSDLEALRELSSSLTKGIAELASLVTSDLGGYVVFYGGDELLARVELNAFHEEKLLELMRRFAERTGVTISIGVGRTTQEAFINLAQAKALGPGSLYSQESSLSR